VQIAARKVAWENAQLRHLLALKGVTNQDINDFIRSRERIQSVHGLSETATKPEIQTSGGVRGYGRQFGASLHHISENTQLIGEQQPILSPNPSPPDPSVVENGPKWDTSTITSSIDIESQSLLEMSCEAAASIIAGMRGIADKSLARSELGCQGEAKCSVKNIKVLQVMEMD
jgi:hypothetical protein